MKIIFQVLILANLAIFFNVNANEKTSIDVGKALKLNKAFENTKFILSPPKKTRAIFAENIQKINSECCDKEFSKKSDLELIKKALQDCLDTACEKYSLPIFNPENPPKKLVAYRYIQLIDDLLMENENFKYSKLSKEFDNSRSEKLKNEKNIEVLKKNIKDLENENLKLKKTVDKMLKSYQTKIKNLEEKNKTISDNFDLVYEAHSKNKQKKLDKELK